MSTTTKDSTNRRAINARGERMMSRQPFNSLFTAVSFPRAFVRPELPRAHSRAAARANMHDLCTASTTPAEGLERPANFRWCVLHDRYLCVPSAKASRTAGRIQPHPPGPTPQKISPQVAHPADRLPKVNGRMGRTNRPLSYVAGRHDTHHLHLQSYTSALKCQSPQMRVVTECPW